MLGAADGDFSMNFKPIFAIGALAWALAVCGAAHALTDKELAKGFRRGVADYCVPSVAQKRPLAQWAASERPGLSPAEEVVRKFVQAEPGDTVWNLTPGSGGMFLVEKASGKCMVTGFGPPVQTTFNAVGAALTVAPLLFQRRPSTDKPDAIMMFFSKGVGTDTVAVDLVGSEPGMPDHLFRYTQLNAFVSREPAPAKTGDSGSSTSTVADIISSFTHAVVSYCLPSILGGVGLGQLPADPKATLSAKVALEGDIRTWDVLPGRGIVNIRERSAGDCRVLAYGPPVATTFDLLGKVLVDAPFNMTSMPGREHPGGVTRRYVKQDGRGGSIVVELIGNEKGSLPQTPQSSLMTSLIYHLPPPP
jgi:hypothetical protein